MQGTKKLIVAAIAAVMLALPVQAAAQSPTNDAYDDSSVQSVDPADPGDPVDPADPADPGYTEENTGGSLPFTGTDVLLLLGAGAVLMAVGFGIRRLTRQTADPA
jgi:hypothetical protein